MFDSIWGDIKNTLTKSKSVVPKLILINILVFILINGIGINLVNLFGRIFGFDYRVVLHLFSLPVQLTTLAYQPWSIFTYGFLHEGIGHIFFNMLFLYFMGNLIQEYLGNRKLLTVFLAGIIISGVVEVLAYQGLRFGANYYPVAYTIGASGGVMAVMLAAATLLPDFEIQFLFFPIRLKYIALFYVLMDALSLGLEANWGGHVAHIAGAIFGYLYVKDIYRHAYIDSMVTSIENVFKPKPKIKVTYRSSKGTSTYGSSSNLRRKRPNQNEIDAILDKISQSGYDSLTKHEKEILFAASHEE
jgi:membrane associated rhomboid family serine protease